MLKEGFCAQKRLFKISWNLSIQYNKFPNLKLKFYFPIAYSWLFCHKLIDCICMDIFLGFLFYSIDLCVCFYANTILF